MAAGAAVTWETCHEAGCLGARIGPDGSCLAHVPADVLAHNLGLSRPGVDVHLDGRGAHFTRAAWARVADALPVDASGRRRLGTVRFDGARFDAVVSFDDVAFSGPVSAVGATFEGDARFGGATFAQGADFSGTTFGAQAWFVGASFTGPVSFRAARFLGPAWFQRTSFAAMASFDEAVFSKDATVTRAVFSGVGSFCGTVFQSHARFEGSTAAGGWRFDGARFREGDDIPEQLGLAAAAPRTSGPPLPLPPLPPAPPSRRGRRRRARWVGPVVGLASLVLIAGVVYAVFRPESESTGFKDYAFLHTNQRTGAPTRYNPCEPVRYVVNPDMSPPGAMEALDQAVAEVSKASGLTFEKVGTTTETVSLRLPAEEQFLYALPYDTEAFADFYQAVYNRPSHQPQRYGDRWAPVLIGWSAFEELGVAYSHQILGLGASEPHDVGPVGETTTFVSGTVMMNVSAPFRNLKGMLMHELGHVVGLAHVDSRDEVMYSETKRQDHWGEGDLEGLRRLGKKAGCVAVPPPG
jgi:hypothetical protein